MIQAAKRALTSLPADLNDRLGEGCFGFNRLRVGLEVPLRRNQVHEFFRDVDELAEARRALESIVHPRVHELLNDRVAALKTDYCILAIPLLVEGGRIPVDRVLVVDCPRETQLSRLLERDGETPEGAERILNAQATREARLARADDVLPNSGTLADLERAVGALHHRYMGLAGTG